MTTLLTSTARIALALQKVDPSLHADFQEILQKLTKYEARYETDMHYQKKLETKNKELQEAVDSAYKVLS